MSKRKRPSGKKPLKPYQSPRLAVHGDLHELTKAKAADKADGTGKPATRNTGTPA